MNDQEKIHRFIYLSRWANAKQSINSTAFPRSEYSELLRLYNYEKSWADQIEQALLWQDLKVVHNNGQYLSLVSTNPHSPDTMYESFIDKVKYNEANKQACIALILNIIAVNIFPSEQAFLQEIEQLGYINVDVILESLHEILESDMVEEGSPLSILNDMSDEKPRQTSRKDTKTALIKQVLKLLVDNGCLRDSESPNFSEGQRQKQTIYYPTPYFQKAMEGYSENIYCKLKEMRLTEEESINV